MMSLNEMFGPKQSQTSSCVTPTYTTYEVIPYQLEMTLNAHVRTQAKLEKLVSHMTHTLGYERCDVDTVNNTVRIFSLTGINAAAILKYVKKHMDRNASARN